MSRHRVSNLVWTSCWLDDVADAFESRAYK